MSSSVHKLRCPWVGDSTEMIRYHDSEWGVPVYDDRTFFEFLTLEAAQAGLSWLTVLRKRDGYRTAFAAFDPSEVSLFDAAKIEQLMENAAIIRNRAKIMAAVSNARCFLEVQIACGSFAHYLWGFSDGKPQINRPEIHADVRITSPESDALAKDLKRRGFKFLGSTVVYAFMQATGMVDDHVIGCFRKAEIRTTNESWSP